MLNLRIITVGKLKERYLTDGCAEYLKRLSAFAKVQLIELDESRLPERPSAAQIEAALAEEGKKILEKAKGSAIIALCIEGEQLSSEGLSALLSKWTVQGESAVSLVIGSSFGLSDQVKQTAKFRLSMSKMTFPHQLARLMLCEQLYRACSIASGGKYHK